MEIEGKVIEIMDHMQVTEKFGKREFVVETPDDKYPQEILLQTVQDNCDILTQIRVGDRIKVQFNLKGRRWEKDGNTKWFNSLDAWKIEKINLNESEDVMPELPDDGTNDLPF